MPDILTIMITPLALIVGALLGTWRNGLDRRSDLGLQRPGVRHTVIFTAGFAFLMALHELLYQYAGMGSQGNEWRKYSQGALALRVLFVGLIYPLAEEFFFRGFLLGVITRKAGAVVGIVTTALLFTALHGLTADGWIGPVLLVADGAYFAFVRLRSGSLLLPVAFHVLGNSIAILQRLY